MKISKAGVGMYITLFMIVLTIIGIDFDKEMMTEAVFSVIQGFGSLIWIIGQVMRKDLSFGIIRKK